MDPKAALAWAGKSKSLEDRVRLRAATLPPGDREGTVKHPFPVVDRDEYKAITKGKGIADRTHKAPIEDVPLASLTAIQKTVNKERLAEHLADPHLIPKGKLGAGHGGLIDHPIIVRSGGKNFIHDGHHRAVVAHVKGQPTISVRVVDLDEK